MHRTFVSTAFVLAALLSTAPATAATWLFASPLTPEVPGATGSGSVQVTFDTTARTLAITSDWSGLSGTTTVAHIHCCVAPPGTVGVAVTPITLPGFPVGVTSGSYSTLLDLTQSTTYTSGFLTNFGGGTVDGAEAALLAGLQSRTAYFNVHTMAFPGGEIRGFMSAVPEPQSWALMIMGFGAVGGVMRRRGIQQRLRQAAGAA